MSPNNIEDLRKLRDKIRILYPKFYPEHHDDVQIAFEFDELMYEIWGKLESLTKESQTPALFKPLQGG